MDIETAIYCVERAATVASGLRLDEVAKFLRTEVLGDGSPSPPRSSLGTELVREIIHHQISGHLHPETATLIADRLAADIMSLTGGVAQRPTERDDSTDHIDWDTMAEERLGQRPRSEHGRPVPKHGSGP